jgi:two-component sensor histidine kinase
MSASVRILYIDDDTGLGRLIQKALSPSGISVHHVTSGGEGLRLLAQEKFDAIALDHDLVSETGLDILPRILALPSAPPVIYLTGSDEARIAVSALKAGAVDYVWKDAEGHYRELLVKAVATALAQDALRREKEAAERAVHAAKDRAELLLAEVNHRIGNSLMLVSSLTWLQANVTEDDACKRVLSEVQARILAIANVHRHLYTSTDVRHVEMQTYLQSLLAELGMAMNDAELRHIIRLDAEPGLRLATDKAVSVGVIVTELVTNAYKYAYPDSREGEIRVALRRHDKGLRVTVEDDGVGWTGEGAVQGTGVGTRIVTAMAGDLGSSVMYASGHPGTRAIIEFSA